MAKRKAVVDSDEEESAMTSSEQEAPKKPKAKPKSATKPVSKGKAAKKPSFEDSEDEESEEEERPIKKKQRAEKPSSSKASSGNADRAGALNTDNPDEKYIDLGKRKRATVRAFKGAIYVDIREFYEAGGEEKPGKKGISLSAEQWEVLKDNAEIIDTLLAKLKKK